MEDLSARCVKVDVEHAPSVSYISMIERGKRVPSEDMLGVIATVFQKEIGWFLDDVPELDVIVPDKGNRGGLSGMALEPSFLFSNEILQIAIPEMLTQTGVSGRQFAQLLIRAHQENNKNQFPELERAADEIGRKQMPISIATLTDICAELKLKISWFNRLPKKYAEPLGLETDRFVRSFFEAPNTIHLNQRLRKEPNRLKYDLAVYIGHKVLHNGDGLKSVLVTGAQQLGSLREGELDVLKSSAVDAQDIMHAWRDFECSFFAGALLCPKVPFRRLIESKAHEVSVAKDVEVSTSVVMRRMTAVSSYPHWHYFDAYPPGKLSAVYRGNGIPLPWGNMRMVQDPCQHWAVFRMLDSKQTDTSAQISLLDVGDETRLYCCESVRVSDVTGQQHVLCAGIDINPALDAQGLDGHALASELKQHCVSNGGSASILPSVQKELSALARILNIDWLDRGLQKDARVICPRRGACPRIPQCDQSCA